MLVTLVIGQLQQEEVWKDARLHHCVCACVCGSFKVEKGANQLVCMPHLSLSHIPSCSSLSETSSSSEQSYNHT